jgi:2-polyprenyl-3-methyl-5-hydroxy-6-metoxy-1,4-benzoquinol methylase
MTNALDDYLAAYQDDFPYAYDNAVILDWYPREIIARTQPDARVLELGVGHGLTCRRFAEHFRSYEVLDGSQAVIEQFHRNYPGTGAITHHAYFEDFEPAGQYDLIIMGFVLEHVEDPAAILRRYRTFLAPGGRVVVAVPNAASLHRRLGQAAGLLPDLMALGAGDRMLGHLRLYTVETLQALLEQTGHRVMAREGIFLKPFTTDQLRRLDLSPEVLRAMCIVGRDYPELSAALLFTACAQ